MNTKNLNALATSITFIYLSAKAQGYTSQEIRQLQNNLIDDFKAKQGVK